MQVRPPLRVQRLDDAPGQRLPRVGVGARIRVRVTVAPARAGAPAAGCGTAARGPRGIPAARVPSQHAPPGRLDARRGHPGVLR